MNSENQHSKEIVTVRQPDVELAVIASFPLTRWIQHAVIVGVSGGPDSVALLNALLRISAGEPNGNRAIHVAHCNYQLRGDESNEDEHFVRSLAADNEIACHVWRGDTRSKPKGIGLEAHLRALRYGYFRELAAKIGARYIAVGHTKDDQVETILFRLLRGSSLRGLSGIPPVRRLSPELSLVRPLLNVSRTAIFAYLDETGSRFRTDSSNQSLQFTRNRIRHLLLPLLELEYSGQVRQRLFDLGKDAATASEILAAAAQEVMSAACRFGEPSCVQIDGARLKGVPEPVIRQMLVLIWEKLDWSQREMTRNKWTQLAAFVGNDSRSQCSAIQLPCGRIARRASNEFVSIV